MDFSRLLPSRFVIAKPKRSGDVHSGFPLFKPGLSLKLSLIVIGVSLTGVLLSSLLVLTLQRRQLIDSAQIATVRLSNAIEASLERAMVENDWPLVDHMVQSVVAEDRIERIRILDAQGVVRVSSSSEEVGERFDRGGPSCQFCHPNTAQPGNQAAILTAEDGREALLNVNLIRNRPQCAGCHDPQAEVLGLLMIEMPLTDLQGQLAAGLRRIMLSALVTCVVLVGLMVLALRKFLIRPVGELARGATEIGAGNLDYPVRAASRDELGELARSFDVMRQRLKETLAGLERRNRELSVLNEVALAASQLLDLQQILDLALDTVVDMLGMQAGSIYLRDEESGRFTQRACRDLSQAQCQEIERLRQQPGGDLSRQVVQTGQVMFVADMAAEDRFQGLWDDVRDRSYVNVPLKSRGAVVGTMGLVTYAGQPLMEREVEVLKAVGHEIGVAIDNASLLAETRRREREAETLYQLGTQISASLELGHVLDVVAEASRRVLATDIGVVGLLDEERREVSVKAITGTRTEVLRDLRVPGKGEVSGSLLASGQPLIVEEFGRDLLTSHARDLIAAEGVVSFLGVPLKRGERLLGLVGVMTRQHRRFSQEDVQLLTRLAHQVVVAIENARLYQQVRHLTALEERDRLAREIHDHLAQSLGYLSLEAAITDELLSGGQVAQAQASLRELREVAKEAYTDVREAIFSLRETVLPGSGLLPSLREYLAEYRTHYGVEARLEVDDEALTQIPAHVGIQIIRIVKEALTNVRKHAGASRAWVRFEGDGDWTRIIVEDDGRGFDPAQVAGEGSQYFGLQIMRERAESVGGSLELDSQPGKGTWVVIRVPRPPRE
jgi:nitrate/nitrite-specific signal transduction histidine kinase